VITHIKTVAVYVEDQARALDFYTTKLGFEVRRTEAMGAHARCIELAPQGAETCVVIYPRSMMPQWEQLKPSIVFACQDIMATYALLKSRGVDFIEEPKKMAWGRFARFRDPDGNEFVLTSPLQSGDA
jgi:predicted enzyme related to lactoylglutathione lyase